MRHRMRHCRPQVDGERLGQRISVLAATRGFLPVLDHPGEDPGKTTFVI